MSIARQRREPGKAPHRRFYWAQVAVAAAFLSSSGGCGSCRSCRASTTSRSRADNFVKELELPAVRGQILDRNGSCWPTTGPRYNVYGDAALSHATRSLQRLRRLLPSSTRPRWRSSSRRSRRSTASIASASCWRSRTSPATSWRSSSREKDELPGVAVDAVAHRSYPARHLASHVLGYMNQIIAEELAQQRAPARWPRLPAGRLHRARRPRAAVGVASCAARTAWSAWWSTPRGSARRWSSSDIRVAGAAALRVDPVPGHNVVTTLDVDLQEITENALKKHKSAAAAVVEVDTGRVLALASWPEPDPNLLTGRLTRARPTSWRSDPRASADRQDAARELLPRLDLQDRAHAGGARGSRWWIPTSASSATASIRFGRREFHCVEPHGKVDLHQALSRVVQRLLLPARRQAGARPHAARGRGPRLRRAHGAWPQRRGARLHPDDGLLQEERRLPEGHGAQHRHRSGRGQGDGAAAGHGLRRHRQRRQAVGAADRSSASRRRRARWCRSFPPRLRRDACRLARTCWPGCARRCTTRSTIPRAPASRRASPASTWPARPARRRCDNNRHVRDGRGLGHASTTPGSPRFAPAKHPEIAVVVLVEHGGFGAKAATPVAMEIYKGYFDKVGAATRLHPAVAARRGSRRRHDRSAARKLRAQFDWPLAGAMVAITAIGLVNLYSATQVAPKGLYQNQLIWFAVGLRALRRGLVDRLPRLRALRLRALRRGAGAARGGAARRARGQGLLALVAIGPVGVQPSEFAKLGIILAHGQAVLRRSARSGAAPVALRGERPWRCCAVPAALIIKQPDLGTALILLPRRRPPC